MKKGLLVVNEFLNDYKDRFNALYLDLEQAFLSNDIVLTRVTNKECLIVLNEKKQDYDFVLFWDKDVNLAIHLENLGYQVFNNSEAIAICDDKAKTYLTLEPYGIKMPKTIISPFTFSNNPFNINNIDYLDDVERLLHFPLVLKEAFGSFGKEVYLINNKEELINKTLELSPRSLLYQEYIASSHGRDVRIEVVGGKVLGAVLRKNDNGDFRSNVLQGGSMSQIDIDPSFIKMAEDVSKILKLDFAGIDIMFGINNEPILCEVNSNVHFRTFAKTTGINLAKVIAEYIKNKIK